MLKLPELQDSVADSLSAMTCSAIPPVVPKLERDIVRLIATKLAPWQVTRTN